MRTDSKSRRWRYGGAGGAFACQLDVAESDIPRHRTPKSPDNTIQAIGVCYAKYSGKSRKRNLLMTTGAKQGYGVQAISQKLLHQMATLRLDVLWAEHRPAAVMAKQEVKS